MKISIYIIFVYFNKINNDQRREIILINHLILKILTKKKSCFPIPPAQNDNPLYETPAIKEVAPVYVNEKIREMNSNEDLVARREKLALAALKRLNQSNNE